MESVSLHLSVTGMTCGACSSTIEKQTENEFNNLISTKYQNLDLQNFECTVGLMTEECIIKFSVGNNHEEAASELEEIKDVFVDTIEDCGFGCNVISFNRSNSELNKEISEFNLFFKVGGMTCGACSSTITEQVTELINNLENENLLANNNVCNVSLVTEECVVTLAVKDSKKVDDIAQMIVECIEDCGFDCDFIASKALKAVSKQHESLQRTVTLELLSQLTAETLDLITNHMNDNENILNVELISTNKHNAKKRDMSHRLQNDSFYTLELTYIVTAKTNIRTLIEDLNSNFSIEAVPKFCNSSAIQQQQQLEALNRTKDIAFWKTNLYISGFIACFTMTFYMFIPMFFNHKQMPTFGPYRFVNAKYFKISFINILGLVAASYLQFGPLGQHFWKACKKSVKKYSGTMDTLVCISTFSAYSFSVYSIINIMLFNGHSEILFETSTMLFCFICLGKFLENTARAKTTFVLSKIMTISPKVAFLFDEVTGLSKEISTDVIEINDILEIKPGSKIPCDGVVYKGSCEIDEQILTGESQPVAKQEDDKLIHGSVNGHTRFLMTAKKVGDETSLLKLLEILKNAQLSKAPMQEFADKLASKFVPFVVILSFISFLFWMFYCKLYGIPKVFLNKSVDEINENFKSNYFFEIFKIAVSVVIVACPCALGLAAPTGIIVGTGLAAENGILMKNGKILQNFQNIDVFVMDKTGTLTLGDLFVENFELYNDFDFEDIGEKEILTLTLLLESASEHSTALTIVKYCKQKVGLSQVDRFEMTNVEINVGKGVYGEFKDKVTGRLLTLSVGNKNTLSKTSLANLEAKIVEKSLQFANTDIYISLNSNLVGQFSLNDNLKNDSKDVVYYLTNILNKEVYMCTGDNKRCAYKFGDELGIPRNYIKYEVSPFEKHDLVADLQEQGKRVVFVGDGINDSLALVKANLGVSIMNDGLDIVMESSDVVIMNNNSLVQLIYCIEIANRTFDKIKSNFFWSLIYNVFMLPIAMGLLVPFNITLNPILAGAAMALSSVSVVVNSLLIRNWEPVNIENISSSNLTTVPRRGSFERLYSWVKTGAGKIKEHGSYEVVARNDERIYEMV